MNANLPIAMLVAAALVVPASAAPRGGGVARSGGGHGPRMSAPRSGGSAPRVAAPRGGTAPRSVSPGGVPAARGTARGVARYGYGGYGHGYGYPYYGYGYGYPYYGYGYPYYSYWGYPWWGVGWYGGCWDCYGPGYYTYAPSGDYEGGGYDAPVGHGPVTIETKVSPSSATVVVDGEEFGFAGDYDGRWDRLTLNPGKHSITFREKGHRSLTIEIDAQPGARYVFKDVLSEGEGEDNRTVATHPEPSAREAPSPVERPAATGRLRIHAEPGDAAIYLDGEYLGLAAELSRVHAALAVPTGTHRLEAARPGFATAVKSIEVGETDLAVVEIKLDSER